MSHDRNERTRSRLLDIQALFAFHMTFTAYAQLKQSQVAAAFVHLGFPTYFRIDLSWAKLAGVVALLADVVLREKSRTPD
jgi:hypothetical protein